jgi:hypothetical protein
VACSNIGACSPCLAEENKMRFVGSAAGVDIRAPEDAYFSYFNSPYISHSQGSSIDIYPSHKTWGEDVASPVSGKLTQIKKMKMGKPKVFPTDDFDYAIAIKPENSDDAIVRIMHCKPSLKVSDSVAYGDSIGVTLRSRYFNYWTGPHYHVEIMHEESFKRSSMSYEFERTIATCILNARQMKSFPTEFELELSEVTKDFVSGYSKGFGWASYGNLKGLPASDSEGSVIGILDGGIPHYKHGGIIGGRNLEIGEDVFLTNTLVGTATHSNKFRRGPVVSAFIDGQRLRGISCFIYPTSYSRFGRQPLILVPQRYDQFTGSMKEGDTAVLQLGGENNRVKAP